MSTRTPARKSERSFWEKSPKRREKDPPEDPNARRLVVTVVGDIPFWISSDESHAMWNASDDAGRNYVIQGALSRLAGGEMLNCEGRWKNHATHGWSFHVDAYVSALPQSVEGIQRWLETRVVGIGPTFAKAITDQFGEKAFETIDANPEVLYDLKSAKGTSISRKQVEKVIQIWDEAKYLRQVETFLFSHGITAKLADKLYRRFGDEVIEVLSEDPYRITQVKGVGFKIADGIALKAGVGADDPQRIRASIGYVLEEAESDGHVFLGLEQFHHRAVDALGISDPAAVSREAQELAKERSLVVESDDVFQQRVYRRKMWSLEVDLARIVRTLLEPATNKLLTNLERPVLPEGMSEDEARAAHIYVPTDEQWSAVEMVANNRLSLLTGGPGVGKTASQDMILHAATKAGKKVLLAAPTGKAARRMTEITGVQAKTIHRLLEWSPMNGGFQRNSDDPLEADLVICDEASMLSLDLADALISAIGPSTHLLLVGDPDQLPPIGAGKVLSDLLECANVPRTHLSRIFRQAAGSMIITNAHRINHGQIPFLRHAQAEAEGGREMLKDFFWVGREKPEQTAALAVEFAAERIPRTFNMDPARDIMVLAPMRKGACGLEVLNEALQGKLNPSGAPIGVKNIRVGDRVIQNQNDYTHGREIMNGELGIVCGFDKSSGLAKLEMDDDRLIEIPTSDMDTFTLAWAISIHKFQGSQQRAIVCALSTAHYNMLSRSLLYTAVTRAQQLCVVVGEKKALQMSVAKVDSRRRNSTLALRIQSPEESGELF